jgi:hypothetical protein
VWISNFREGLTMSEGSPQKPVGAVSAPEEDLSRKIEEFVDREPHDLVKCVHVFGNYYRCNWWSRAAARTQLDYAWVGRMADFVRKSRFLSATMNADELIVKEIGPVGPHQRNLVREA